MLWVVASCNTEAPTDSELGSNSSALTSPAPMDLVTSGSSDLAGIWQDPMWGIQVTQPGSLADPQSCFYLDGWFTNPECTTQPTSIDEASGLAALICEIGADTPIAGHVNWRAANYGGPIYWRSQSTADADYKIDMPTKNRNGLTIYNPSAILGEFDARETVNHFVSAWWTAFRSASNSTKQAMVNGKPSIMVGLMGLDCEHGCWTESHPVWALAIHVKDDPKDDVWAVFARNWGNEGFCSSHQHLVSFPNNRYTFRFPWRADANRVSLASGTAFYANKSGTSVSWGYVGGQQVTLSLQLLSPSSYSRIHGELHLRWHGVSATGATAVASTTFQAELSDSTEQAIAELIENLDPVQRAAFDDAVAAPPTSDTIAVPFSFGAAEPPTMLSQSPITVVADPATAAANERRLMALRQAYGAALPGEIGAEIERAFTKQAP